VEAVENTGRHEIVYNMTVRDAHTFFVGKPEWDFALWVHNLNLCLNPSFAGKTPNYIRKAARPKNWQLLPADGKKGWKLVDENGIERVRYMYPDKNSKWYHGKTGYFRRQDAAGNWLDEAGNIVSESNPLFNQLTHIVPSGI
jgi:hypothetical protein